MHRNLIYNFSRVLFQFPYGYQDFSFIPVYAHDSLSRRPFFTEAISCPSLAQIWNRIIWLLRNDETMAVNVYAYLLEEAGVYIVSSKFKRALENFATGPKRYGFCLLKRIGAVKTECVEKPVGVFSSVRVLCLDKDMITALEGAPDQYPEEFRLRLRFYVLNILLSSVLQIFLDELHPDKITPALELNRITLDHNKMQRQQNALTIEERLWGGKIYLGIQENTWDRKKRVCFGGMVRDWKDIQSVAVNHDVTQAEVISSNGGLGNTTEFTGW